MLYIYIYGLLYIKNSAYYIVILYLKCKTKSINIVSIIFFFKKQFILFQRHSKEIKDDVLFLYIYQGKKGKKKKR